jgi:hypothetical protein
VDEGKERERMIVITNELISLSLSIDSGVPVQVLEAALSYNGCIHHSQ